MAVRRLSIRLLAVAAVAAVVSAATPSLAQGLMSESKARAAIEETYGVQVLSVEEIGKDGWQAFVVKVMNPPGDFDEAFQVNTLVIDRQTGLLVPQFRHLPAGHQMSAPSLGSAGEGSGEILRRGSIR